MHISVGRVHTDIPGYANVKIDRTTSLGNPFYMRDESMRNTVCDMYQEYFMRELEDRDSYVSQMVAGLLKTVRSGKDLHLQCHCAPKRCHGNTIKQYLLKNA